MRDFTIKIDFFIKEYLKNKLGMKTNDEIYCELYSYALPLYDEYLSRRRRAAMKRKKWLNDNTFCVFTVFKWNSGKVEMHVGLPLRSHDRTVYIESLDVSDKLLSQMLE